MSLTLDDLRDRVRTGRMNQSLWEQLTPETRDMIRDESGLTPMLRGWEGYRVEVADLATGALRRFIVGRSTGWKPCHLEIHNRRSMGGRPADAEYRSIRILDNVRGGAR